MVRGRSRDTDADSSVEFPCRTSWDQWFRVEEPWCQSRLPLQCACPRPLCTLRRPGVLHLSYKRAIVLICPPYSLCPLLIPSSTFSEGRSTISTDSLPSR